MLISPLYSKITKLEKFFNEGKTIKNVKITKRSHAYKDFAGTYNADILNSFNLELKFWNLWENWL